MIKKIALVVAHEGYQPVEYGVTKKILEKEGYAVVTVSDQAGFACATDNTKAEVTYTVDELDLYDIDALFIIGGSGELEHLDTQECYDIITKLHEAQKPVGAICIATRILAHAGILEGRRATGWNGDDFLNGVYAEHGVNYIKEPCVTDDTIVTADGPSSVVEFAEHIIAVLEMSNYDDL